ncbi:hypothetical protein ACFXAE_23560 [Streptomyces sp. NPDC059454]|uniref:hypothetical protein n=1 Tax=Streptomyces sp. NPDC059454 TaxID=3346836 RepID=UPI0036CCFB2B
MVAVHPGRRHAHGVERDPGVYGGSALPEYDLEAPTKNFSVMALNGVENGNAESLLGQYYTLNRIIDGTNDGFLVKIVG